ncbi:hypothetical protein EDD86DRAFT_199865 [Gorgonomyces haynaldii]|nr:hypothetical protein EDD86DRAFT_199865 [Gorgonomyces haynaldii]
MTGFGFLESIYLVGMVLATADKWKAPVYRLCCVALAAQILSQLLICVGIDFVISPYVASPLLLGFATLIVSLANHVAMICVDCAAMLLIYTFFKGKKMMLIGWFALSGFCILLRVAASIYLLATNTLLSGSNDTSLNYASTSVYVIYSLLVSLNSIVESVYISMAAVVFIRHMIKQLDLPPFEIFKDMILKYGGLKFAALVGIRFFGAGLIIRLVTRNYVADNVTNMANCTLADVRSHCRPPVLCHLCCVSNCVLCDQRVAIQRQNQFEDPRQHLERVFSICFEIQEIDE